MKVINTLAISGLLLLMSATAYAKHDAGMAGDSFRKTAADYEDNAGRAASEATHAKGEDVNRYRELSSIYREMAQIKLRAATKADQSRWSDIKWDRYYQLESRRDQLMGQLNWSHSREQAAKPGGASAFVKAAKNYESQAQQAREEAQRASGPVKYIFTELSKVYDEMAGIKHAAAATGKSAKRFDWSRYQLLEQRRDKLKNQLNHARH